MKTTVTENRHERRRRAKFMLGEVKKVRMGLAMMRACPALPHLIENPSGGDPIDALDGETDRILDEIEAVALAALGGGHKAGNA